MDNFLSAEVLEGIENARKRAMRGGNRLCIHANNQVFPVAKLSEKGFEMGSESDPKLRGLVDVFDGPKHLYQCLIVYSEVQGDAVHYEFKRATEANEQPAADFVRAADAPIALLR